jgi:hypothetical protein
MLDPYFDMFALLIHLYKHSQMIFFFKSKMFTYKEMFRMDDHHSDHYLIVFVLLLFPNQDLVRQYHQSFVIGLN